MKRILIINPFGIGDVIFTMSLVEALRSVYPKAVIGFLCNERTAGLVRLNTSVNQTFVFNRDLFRRLWKKHPFLLLKKLKALLRMVREYQFDAVFDLSLGREYGFFCRWIGIKKRIGFNYKNRGVFLTDKIKIDGYSGRPVAETQLDLLEAAGIARSQARGLLPIKSSDLLKKEMSLFLKGKGLAEKDRLIALAPGGGRSWGANAVFKQWDAEFFAEAVNKYIMNNPAKVMLLGDAQERSLLERTAALLKTSSVVIAGEEIEKVCALLERAELLCCNDGGLLHLANALGVKTVSIFGPVDEKVYGPYGNDTLHAVVTEAVPCRPCYQQFHFPLCPHERRCLRNLPADKVVDAMKKIS